MRSWFVRAPACVLLFLAGPARSEDAPDATTVEIEALPGATPIDELVSPDVAGLPYECQVGAWRLEGVGRDADSFQPVWTLALEEVAGCLELKRLASACVGLRGQVTDMGLSPGAIAAFGSAETARAMKAKSRAALAAAKLDELGVPPGRVVELPATKRPSYDGVSMSLLLSCGPAPLPAAGPRLSAFVELGGAATLQLANEFDSASPGVLVGAGAALGRAFARTQVGYAAAGRREQRSSLDLTAALGWRIHGIVEPAVVGALRYGSTTPSQPWLERSWAVGVEAAHCRSDLWSFADICARGAVLPFGRLWRRGVEDPDGLHRLPEEGFGATRFDFTVFLRRSL